MNLSDELREQSGLEKRLREILGHHAHRRRVDDAVQELVAENRLLHRESESLRRRLLAANPMAPIEQEADPSWPLGT